MKTSGLGVRSLSHTSELCFLQYIKTKQQCWGLMALKTKLFTPCRVFSLCCCGVLLFVWFTVDFSGNCLLLELGCLCKRTHCCLWLGNTTRNCSVPSLFTPAGSQQHLCHEAIAKARIYLLPKRKRQSQSLENALELPWLPPQQRNGFYWLFPVWRLEKCSIESHWEPMPS